MVKVAVEAPDAKLTVPIPTPLRSTEKDRAAVGTTDGWIGKVEALAGTLEDLSVVQRDANKETRRLNGIFSKHDMERLASRRPGLIELRVNDGTAGILKLFSEATSPRDNSPDDADPPGPTSEGQLQSALG